MKKSWYKYFVYVSLIFLAIALYRGNYLKVPEISSYFSLALSILFLFTGFIVHAVSWKKVLEESKHRTSLNDCISGEGLSIFGKYIPGKIWVIAGRAAYISEKEQKSLTELSALSLNTQFIGLWVGLILGSIGLFAIGGLKVWGWLVLILWIFLTVAVFTDVFHKWAQKSINFVLKKDISIPALEIGHVIYTIPWFILYWLFWSTGFYLLIQALSTTDAPFEIGLGFPLAGTLGIMTLISPGGLGAREGIMVGFLTIGGFSTPQATTIAVVSRLWFLAGEVFIFILGWLTDQHLLDFPELRG